MQLVRYLGMNVAGKSRGSPKMFTISVIRDLKKWYEAEGAKDYCEANKDSEVSEESKGGLDRCSMRGE